MKALSFGLVVGVLILLGGCASQEQVLRSEGLKPLSENELKILHTKTRTTQWSNARGNTGAAVLEVNGSAKTVWESGESEGSWEIKNGKFCFTYQSLWNGKERCYDTYRVSESEYQYFISGKYVGKYTYTD